MDKSPDAFRTISEVAEWLGVQAHVLRFWESKFTQVKPVKRAGGRRYYRPADMLLLGGIKKLLHDDGLTIKGVQKTLREQSVAHVSSLSQELCDVAAAAVDAPDDTKGNEAIVVPFKSVAPPPEPELTPQRPEPPDPRVIVAKEVLPEATEHSGAVPDPSPAPPGPVSAAPPDQSESETEPKAEPKPEPPADIEEKPVLPSFLHRPARLTQPETPAETPVETPPAQLAEPVAAQIRPIVVEAPDPPDENDIPHVRGPLTELAGLDKLTVAQIAEIAPLAVELQAWLLRSHGAGAS